MRADLGVEERGEATGRQPEIAGREMSGSLLERLIDLEAAHRCGWWHRLWQQQWLHDECAA